MAVTEGRKMKVFALRGTIELDPSPELAREDILVTLKRGTTIQLPINPILIEGELRIRTFQDRYGIAKTVFCLTDTIEISRGRN